MTSIDGLFLIEEPKPNLMNKDEYLKRTQQLLDFISCKYSESHHTRSLIDSEFPDESVCDKCQDCGVFNLNGEEKECVQDREQGNCFYRYFDGEEFGMSVMNQLEELHSLLGVDDLTI